MSESFELEQDQELEALLRGHLEKRLGGQVGRARLAFAEEVRRGRRRWMWLSAGTAIAAGLLIAWALVGNRGGPLQAPPDSPTIGFYPDSLLGPAPAVQGASWSGFTDAGTVLVEDRPMRQWKRTVLQEYQYYDAANDAMVRTRAPREQVYLIGIETD